MKIDIVTAFPELVSGPLNESMLKRARDRGLLDVSIYDLREFTTDKHHKVDDYPYGGGAGMVMKGEPFFRTMDAILAKNKGVAPRTIYMSPQGRKFNQEIANELSLCDHVVYLCGHYKGIDQRVVDSIVTDEISIGDYVLTGGELPALVVIDAVIRLVPGVLNDLESAETDSFQQDMLDCPYYTRPEELRGLRVPEVLMSGNHERIQAWRRNQSLSRTRTRRKDLLDRTKDLKKTGCVMEDNIDG